jgi:hypothetical protein
MKRTQLQLEDPVYEALRRRAYETRTSMAGLVREAVGAYLKLDRGGRSSPGSGGPGARRRTHVPRLSFIGCFRSTDGDLRPVSERHDEALARAFMHRTGPAPRPKHR